MTPTFFIPYSLLRLHVGKEQWRSIAFAMSAIALALITDVVRRKSAILMPLAQSEIIRNL
jgi:hypothetical protein